MAWRIVKQPNGMLGRFSDVVDNFTHMNLTMAQAYRICRFHLGYHDAKRKVCAGLEDWIPWTSTPGSGHDRWDHSIKTIEAVHGEQVVREILVIGTTDPTELERFAHSTIPGEG